MQATLRRTLSGHPIAAILLWLVFLVSSSGCSGKKPKKAPPPPGVTVARPLRMSVTDYLEMPGNLQAYESVDLVARVEGFLQSIDFKEGAFVKKGQLLFVIEPQPFEAQLLEALATVAQQQATLSQAKAEYERQQRLIKSREAKEQLAKSTRATLDVASL